MFKRKMIIKLYILWTLNNNPKCGYEIQKELQGMFEIKLFSHPVLYVNLHDLNSNGFIKGIPGSRNKTTYEITDKGKVELERQISVAREIFTHFKEFYGDIFGQSLGGENYESTGKDIIGV